MRRRGRAGFALGMKAAVVAAVAATSFAGPTIKLQATLHPEVAPDTYGYNSAADGDTLLVCGMSTQQITVLVRDGAAWPKQARLAPSGVAAVSPVRCVALDGDTAVVATRDDASSPNVCYVFRRVGATWTEEAKLSPSDGAADGTFGSSVAVDGDVVVVGDAWQNALQGAAYVYRRTGAAWTEEAKLVGPVATGNFGWSVAVEGDVVVVGSPTVGFQIDPQIFDGTGALDVYRRVGGTWTFETEILGGPGGAIGRALAFDGGTIAAPETGRLRIVVRVGGEWKQQASLPVTKPRRFGWNVALDGDVAIAGDPSARDDFGVAYVWRRRDGAWSQPSLITVPPNDGSLEPHFARSVAVAGDVALVADGTIGAAAYVFTGLTAPTNLPAVPYVASVSASHLSVGSAIDVAGAGFGSRPPTAWLLAAGRKVPLRIAKGAAPEAFTATLAAVPRGAVGSAVLHVLGRGTKVPSTFEGLAIELPKIDAVTPPQAGAGATITIDGTYFGTRKGTVRIGTRACKVLTWTDARITVVAPKRLAAGPADVKATNTVGSATSVGGFTAQ